MNIGFIGMGKLGMPVALAIEKYGHKVVGYDISMNVKNILDTKRLPYKELEAQSLLDITNIEFLPMSDVVKMSDIIFVPVQTPHLPLYEGITRIPIVKSDFDYSFLVQCIRELSGEIEKNGRDKIVIIISTVLPGTICNLIKPLLGSHTKLCYNPFFIAMGTTIQDFTNPEFVLFGVDDDYAAMQTEKFYKTIHNKPFVKMSIESAELTKVAYNTFISIKIAFVNTLMEICHRMKGPNIDDVTNALKLATDRLISTKYLSAGMGDGGGCHPRDNIALSWLSKKLNLSHDIFDNIMMARERQAEWFVDIIKNSVQGIYKPKILILGKAFKPETNLTTGSPSILLKNLLIEYGYDVKMYDPYVDNECVDMAGNDVIFIGTKHEIFDNYKFPNGSTVIDPFRYIHKQNNVNIIRLGENK